MTIKQKLNVYSKDLNLLFKVEVGKKNIIDIALKKIATLYTKAKAEHIYALAQLHTICEEISELSEDMHIATNELKQKIANTGFEICDIKFPLLQSKQYNINIPPIAIFLSMLRNFDSYVKTSVLARTAGVYSHNKQFHNQKSSYKKAVFKLVSKISLLQVKSVPNVTIEQYLSESTEYIDAAETFGVIEPETVHFAMNSPVISCMRGDMATDITINLRNLALVNNT